MPNRIIKESICTSEEIDRLSSFQETVFYRLIVNCDDFGRMDARAKILKSKLFPLKDIRVDQIETALKALASAELVILYEVDGKPFLQMKTWGKHQQMRAQKSKYPAPDNTCHPLISNDIKCPRNPIQSENESESEANSAREEEDDGFEAFWGAFPQKSGDIRQAYFEYCGVLQSGVTKEELLEAATWQAEEKGRYMGSPEKWLRNKGWTEKKTEKKPDRNAPVSNKPVEMTAELMNYLRELEDKI